MTKFEIRITNSTDDNDFCTIEVEAEDLETLAGRIEELTSAQ